MNSFTGTIDDFMNENDNVIDKLILDRINKEDLSYNLDSMNKRLIHIKNIIKEFFIKEFGDWEIDLDLESFENSFDYNFYLLNKDIKERVIFS